MPSQEELVAMVKHQARKHLIDFSIATNRKYKPNWHHEVLAEELEKVENGTADWKVLIVMMPPRSGKSEECTVNFPAWYLGKNPDKEIITVSYSADLALDFGTKTRNLVNSSAYQSIFNLELRADEKSKAKWKTKEGGSYTSVGMGGAMTGRGANIALIDDPLKNREDADSKVIREKQWSWFISTLFTRLEPNGKVILVLTRWHLDDLAGKIIANEELRDKTKIIKFPAIAISDEKFRKSGEALWEERYSLSELKSIKATLGIYEWSALYQQHPVLTENQEFRKEWVKYRNSKELDLQDTRKFLTIDTAVSKRDEADNTGFCDNSVDQYDNWNFRAWHMKIDPKELIDLLFILHEKRSYEKIGIEKTVYLSAIKPFLYAEMTKRKRYLPIVELEHKQIQKEIRIRALIPRYAAGKIYHLESECSDLEEEMFTFPKGIHDDVLDASAYQVQIAEDGSSTRSGTTVPRSQTQDNIYNGI